MKRSALFFALLLAAVPALAAPQNYGIITTKGGKSFYECKIVRVHPDGVAFTHRDGAAKIAFKELPESMRREFRYDPQADAKYRAEQEAQRKEEKKREKQREIAMEEKLMEAQMAEASYLASASTVYNTTPAPMMSTALPGEPAQTIMYQSPSWTGSPIGTTSLGGNVYRRSYWGGYPYYGGGYGYGGYYPGYSYPYAGYGYGHYGHGHYHGGYANPTFYRSWNVGSGIRLGVGVSPFGYGGVRLFR